jgi:hypothetical protein
VAARRVEVELGPRSVERVAARVAELLEQRRVRAQDDLVCAGELARRLGVRRPWVYRRATALGGFRIGDGPKAEWRFDLLEAGERFRRLQGGQPEEER